MKFLSLAALALMSLSLLAIVKYQTYSLENFLTEESLRRYPTLKLSSGNKVIKASKEVEQIFRKKMLEEDLIAEAIKEDPALYYKTMTSIQQKELLHGKITDSQGRAMEYIITNGQKCALKEGRYSFKASDDLSLLCHEGIASLFKQSVDAEINFVVERLNTKKIPQELSRSWEGLINDSLRSLAVQRAYEKSQKGFWL